MSAHLETLQSRLGLAALFVASITASYVAGRCAARSFSSSPVAVSQDVVRKAARKPPNVEQVPEASQAFDLGRLLAVRDRWDREDAFDRHVRTLTADGVKALWSKLAAAPPSPARDVATAQLFEQWGRLDPSSARDAAALTTDRYQHMIRLSALVRGWAEVDARGVLEAAVKGGPQFSTRGMVGGTGTQEGVLLKLSLEWAMVEQERYGELAAMAAEHSMLFRSIGGSRRDPLSRAWAEADFPAALAWARGLSDLDMRETSLGEILGFLGETDPARAMALAEEADASHPHRRVTSEVLGVWAREDPLAAFTWLEAHQYGGNQSTLVYRFLVSAASEMPELSGRLVELIRYDEDTVDSVISRVGSENPPMVADWIVRYNLPVDPQTLRRLFGRWVGADLQGAREFILNDPRLSDDRRRELSKLLPAGP